MNAEPSGILAVGGDLSVQRLLLAYSNGIFPWFSEGDPILWFSPDPRMIIEPDELYVSRRLRKVIKSKKYEVRFDTDFEEVITNCSRTERKGQDGTWITEDMIDAYIALHHEGYAHSVETYYEDRLVGGLYGVSLGAAFFGESMFHLMSDASKVALYHLTERLGSWEFDFIDSQVPNDHMRRMGGCEIDRNIFLEMLDKALTRETITGSWESDNFLKRRRI